MPDRLTIAKSGHYCSIASQRWFSRLRVGHIDRRTQAAPAAKSQNVLFSADLVGAIGHRSPPGRSVLVGVEGDGCRADHAEDLGDCIGFVLRRFEPAEIVSDLSEPIVRFGRAGARFAEIIRSTAQAAGTQRFAVTPYRATAVTRPVGQVPSPPSSA